MPNEPLPDDLFRVWQNQPLENTPMPLEEIRNKARKFEETIGSRNRREYVIGAAVTIAFTFYIFHFSNSWMRAGSVLVIAGTLYAMYQMYRRSSPGTAPADLGLTASLAFHRRELARQRDLLQSVWSWYIAPMLPGLVVFTIGVVPKRGPGVALVAVFYAVIYAAVFGWMWSANRHAAEQLTREIAELDHLGSQV